MELPRTPTFSLKGRRALVAGGSSGIGLGAAVALAEAGAHVVIAARRRDVLFAAEDALQDAGFSVEAWPLDVTDDAALRDCFEEQKPFDIIVNSAGLARHSPAVETETADFDAVMAVNLRAAYFLAQHGARGMMAAGLAGSIIQISSQMGHVGGAERAVYSASKHGLEGMVKSMAIEWGAQRIRINSVCPTFIRTPLTEVTFSDPDKVKWVRSKIKLPRVGRIEDIMGAVLFLAGDASQMVTGTSILVDGGWTAG